MRAESSRAVLVKRSRLERKTDFFGFRLEMSSSRRQWVQNRTPSVVEVFSGAAVGRGDGQVAGAWKDRPTE